MRTAVVVGSELNALGVVRSLAAGDVPVVVLGPAHGEAMKSRFGRKVPLHETGGTLLVEALRGLARELAEPPVLFLTEEKSVETLVKHRDLEREVVIRLPSSETLTALLHKVSFQAEATRLGAAIPAARSIARASDLEDLRDMRFPCVFKPAWKNYAYGARFKKAYVVRTKPELLELYQQIEPVMPDMILQEWIEGEDSDIYFCLQYLGKDAELVASFAGRKLRSWPPQIGGTASCIAARECEDELTRLTHEFFRATGFMGMGSMEYKRDRRDGKFYMIEPTVGRTDFQEEVATVNGVNIPLAAYLYETTGRRLENRTVHPPVLWRDAQIDRWSMQAQSCRPLEADMPHRRVDAYMRLGDPWPWVATQIDRARSKLTGLWK